MKSAPALLPVIHLSTSPLLPIIQLLSICCLHPSDPAVLSFICFTLSSFSFPAFVLSTNHRAWTRLPWPMPPFWMAAGAGPTVPWLAQWALWLSVFLLSLLSLILSTPQRWACHGKMEAHAKCKYAAPYNRKTKCVSGPWQIVVSLQQRCSVLLHRW